MENKTLLPLKLSNLHHPEVGQIAVRFFTDFATAGLNATTDADFKKLFDQLNALLPDYKKALDQVQASEESEAIAQADRLRDKAYAALKGALKAYRTSDDEAEKPSYKRLQILLDQYKNVDADAYEEETIRMNNLLAALNEPENNAAAETLAISKFITRLAAANSAFDDIFSHRSNKTSQKISYNVKAMRKALEAAYRQLANYVETMAGVREDAFYTDTLAVLNTGRKYFSDTLAKRTDGQDKLGSATAPNQ